MSKHHDKTFFVSFLSVLGFLVLFTVAIIYAARALEGDKELTPQQIAKIEERLTSAGKVNTGAPGAETTPKEPLTGEQVSAQVCGACHMGAIPNAPKIGDKAAWSSRGTLAQLTESAIKGKGAMPPRGGMPSLSDGEIEAGIKHMSGM